MAAVRVLVVDDQEPFRRACATVIECTDGFSLAGVAETGEKAVELADRLSPQLVLMDVNLPGISGLEATRLIRERPDAPVVILVSTYQPGERGDEPRECGAAAYLDKSEFGADVLVRTWLAVQS